MKKLSILTVGVVLVLSVSLAFAGPWGRGRGMGPGSCMEPGRGMGPGTGMGPGSCMALYAASDLNLSAEQSGKLQTQRETYLKEVTPLQNQLFGKKAELRLLWGTQNPDRAEITAKQNEIFDLERQVQEKATSYRLDCRSILTPEQQAQMTAFGPGCGRGRGYGGGHGPRGGRW